MQIIIFTLLIIIAGVTLSINASGQTFAEWWQQKKTRIKRLKQQVAALGTLKEAVEAGYSLAEKGVDSVEVAEEEELSVNKQFIESLRIVKPSFRDEPEVITSYALVDMLVSNVNHWLAIHSNHPLLTGSEIDQISSDLHVLVTEAQHDLWQLIQLTRDGDLEMEDGQRYEAICEAEAHMWVTYENARAYLRVADCLIDVHEQAMANNAFLKTVLQ